MGKILRILGGFGLVVLGIIGLILPIMPGWVFLIPGLIGLGLMSTGLWGIGFSLAEMRTKKLIKRLTATPMRRSDFLLSFLLVRAVLLPIELAPRNVVRTALKAANLIGNGLYGVDLKQTGRDIYIIEVNDNPNIDAGFEDSILREELYRRILEVFLERIEDRKAGLARG